MRARSGGLLDPELIITPDHHVPFLTEGMSKRFSGLNKNVSPPRIPIPCRVWRRHCILPLIYTYSVVTIHQSERAGLVKMRYRQIDRGDKISSRGVSYLSSSLLNQCHCPCGTPSFFFDTTDTGRRTRTSPTIRRTGATNMR